MVKTLCSNQSGITEFILLGFGDLPEQQIFLFVIFMVIYLVTVAGNLLIIMVVVADKHLHIPMYFFLGNLSCLETCYTTTILPQMVANFICMDLTISVSGCITQFYFFCSLASTETWLLAVMSYDRYLAICRPLYYATIMTMKCCSQLVFVAWVSSFLATWVLAFLMSSLDFCGPNEIDHFFCDFTPVAKLSCSDTTPMELAALGFGFMFAALPFLLTIVFYMCIINTILKISSTIGRQKAFSTCSSHLIVVCIFYGTIIIVYMMPDTPTLRDLNKVFSVFYTVLTPLVNPLIYSLRNKEVHNSLRRMSRKLAIFARSGLNLSFDFTFFRQSKS